VFDRNLTSACPASPTPTTTSELRAAATRTTPPRKPRNAFDHLLCVTTANAGGSARRTHDKLKFAVQAVCKAAGLSTFDEPVGEIHGIENPDGTTRGKQPDIRIVGLRQTGITVLVDTAVTNIMAQANDHTSQPEPRQGKAAPTDDPIAVRNRAKNGKYKDAAHAVSKEFIPLVMDTYGRMGKPFLNFLKDVAGHTADRASGNVKPFMTPSNHPTSSGTMSTWQPRPHTRRSHHIAHAKDRRICRHQRPTPWGPTRNTRILHPAEPCCKPQLN
jgi:hypothetical protein